MNRSKLQETQTTGAREACLIACCSRAMSVSILHSLNASALVRRCRSEGYRGYRITFLPDCNPEFNLSSATYQVRCSLVDGKEFEMTTARFTRLSPQAAPSIYRPHRRQIHSHFLSLSFTIHFHFSTLTWTMASSFHKINAICSSPSVSTIYCALPPHQRMYSISGTSSILPVYRITYGKASRLSPAKDS